MKGAIANGTTTMKCTGRLIHLWTLMLTNYHAWRRTEFSYHQTWVGHLMNESEPTKFFNTIFMDEIISDIVLFMNNYGRSVYGDEDWKPVDAVEIRAFLGALIYLGERGLGGAKWDELFKVSCYSINLPLMRALGRDRFKMLYRFLRFDDKVHRAADVAANRVAKIEAVFDAVVKNCRQMLVPSKYITVDESMISYRGRVSFKMYCPAKPDKYGMKIFSLCDSFSGALLNAKAILEKSETRPKLDKTPAWFGIWFRHIAAADA